LRHTVADMRFELPSDVGFSLAAAANFGFGPHTGRPYTQESDMRLAFVTDDLRHHAGVYLHQDDSGTIQATADTEVTSEAIEAQVRRILSLDHPGRAWLEVGRRDPVIGALQEDHPGLRPVLFHSPYEAAAWSILSCRRHRSQAVAVRRKLAATLGRTFVIGGEEDAAFPTPEALLAADELPGVDATRADRLRAVARAALDGALDPEGLRAMEPNQALRHLQQLPGVGPTYATLILLRATGATDIVTLNEPRLPSYLARFYGLKSGSAAPAEITRIAQNWRPYRTWAAVLIRVAGDRLGRP
jgi:DNA-3-methyladenine glycosylase II